MSDSDYTLDALGAGEYDSFGLGDHNYCRALNYGVGWCYYSDADWEECSCPPGSSTGNPLFYQKMFALNPMLVEIPRITAGGSNGTINVDGYADFDQQIWEIESECDFVRISSSEFHTERDADIVKIDGVEYSGRTVVDQLVPASFLVEFSADYSASDYAGFNLQWECEHFEPSGW